jgi:hypothetical protein
LHVKGDVVIFTHEKGMTSMAKGRPPKPEPERKSRYVSFRARSGLQARLAAAAQQSERSVSEEIERRLERSFITEGLGRQLAQQGNLLAKIATRLGVDDAANLALEPVAISGAGSMTANVTVFTRDEVESREDQSWIECHLSLVELLSSLKNVESEQERATILSRAQWLLGEMAIAKKTANFAALSEKLHALTRKPQNVEGK